MARQEFWVRNYEKVGGMPLIWQLSADELLTASELVLADFLSDPTGDSGEEPKPPHLLGAGLMLRGMGMECLLKGVCVAHGEDLASGGRYRPLKEEKGYPHDLVRIAHAATRCSGLTFSEDELDLLRRLSASIEGGRYPIPGTWKKYLQPQDGLEGGYVIGGGWILPTDEERFADLVDRLTTALPENGG